MSGQQKASGWNKRHLYELLLDQRYRYNEATEKDHYGASTEVCEVWVGVWQQESVMLRPLDSLRWFLKWFKVSRVLASASWRVHLMIALHQVFTFIYNKPLNKAYAAGLSCTVIKHTFIQWTRKIYWLNSARFILFIVNKHYHYRLNPLQCSTVSIS